MNMKKLLFFVVLCVFLSGCRNTNKEIKNEDIRYYLNSISLNLYEEFKEDQEELLVYIRRLTCEDCQLFEKRFINDIKNDSNYRNIKLLDIEDLHNNKNEWQKFKNENKIHGTPAFVYFKNGVYIDSFSWNEDDGFDYEKFKIWIKVKL